MHTLSLWLLLVSPTRADVPPVPPVESSTAAPEAPGIADVPTDVCAAPLEELIRKIRAVGSKDTYLCLASRDDAGAALLTAAGEEGLGKERVTRALTVHWMQRLDQRLPGEVIRALNPDDRRLLRDAVYARRGRTSPSSEHAAVFSQFDWYKPNPRFLNSALKEVDRANIADIDHPPPPPEPEPAAAVIAEAAPPASTTGRCGCQSAAGAPLFGLLLAAAAGIRRRP